MFVQRRFWRSAAVMAGVVTLSLGCRPVAGPDLLRNAYDLGEKYQWAEAKPLVKAYLLDHPDSAPAHFLWGRCHLHNTSPHLTIAEGEFQTALQQFQVHHDLDALEGRFSSAEFEGATYRETARVYMRWAREAMQQNVPPAVVNTQLQHALDAVRKGRAVDPASTALAEMEKTLEEYVTLPPAGANSAPADGKPIT